MAKTLTFSSDYNKLFIINEVDDSLKAIKIGETGVQFSLEEGKVVISQKAKPLNAQFSLSTSDPGISDNVIVSIIVGEIDIVASLVNYNSLGLNKTVKYNLKDQTVYLSTKNNALEFYTA